MNKVVVIGAGLAGLSLATELADEGFKVTVLEKNSYLGGRASNTIDPITKDPVPIGPHIFITAYSNFRRFLRKIGAHKSIRWQRRKIIELVSDGKHSVLRTANLPPPLFNVPIAFGNNFMSLFDKVSEIPLNVRLLLDSEDRLEKLDNIDAYTFLRRNGLTKNAIEFFFSFITLSLNNAPLEKLSAAEMTLLFRHWLQFNHHNIGFARMGLGDIYTKNAEAYLKKRKSRIIKNVEVTKIVVKKDKISHLLVRRKGKKEEIVGDVYVSTTTPVDLMKILTKRIVDKNPFSHLKFFEGIAYLSVFLWFDRKISNKRFWALVNTRNMTKHLNTDFYDRSNIMPGNRKYSFIASNIINSKEHEKLSDKEVVEKTLKELREMFPKMKAKLVHSHVHHIPYVIYAPYPGMRKHKLPHKTFIKNFYLAGDWTVPLTQCMEAAVGSGYRCAEKILRDNGINKKLYDPKFN